MLCAGRGLNCGKTRLGCCTTTMRRLTRGSWKLELEVTASIHVTGRYVRIVGTAVNLAYQYSCILQNYMCYRMDYRRLYWPRSDLLGWGAGLYPTLLIPNAHFMVPTQPHPLVSSTCSGPFCPSWHAASFTQFQPRSSLGHLKLYPP